MSRPAALLVLSLHAHCITCTRHGRLGSNATSEYLMSLITSSRPAFADNEFDCSWRRLAFTYASSLQPTFSTERARELHDALQLVKMCGEGFTPPPTSSRKPRAPQAADVTIFISPSGSDSSEGSADHPMQTLGAALNATRHRRAGNAAATAAILLRNGTYYLEDTLVLDGRD